MASQATGASGAIGQLKDDVFRVSCALLLPLEPVFLAVKQDVERGQRAVAAGDVLLEVHLVFVRQLGVAVDVLFQNPQAVPEHDDFVKEGLDGDFLSLEPFFSWTQLHDAPLPLVSQVNGA